MKITERVGPIILAALITGIVFLFASSELATTAQRTNDYVWRLATHQSEMERRIVVIDIDDASVARLGPWPWPRETMAKLARHTAQHGAALQIYDIAFPTAKSGDTDFANELKRNPSVLAQVLALDSTHRVALGHLQSGTTPCLKPFPQSRDYIGNAPSLSANAGHITPRIDRDGSVRRIPAMICANGHSYQALALAALTTSAGLKPDYHIELGKGWLAPHGYLRHPGLPGIEIPVDKQGDILLPWWLKRQHIISISAIDILENRAPTDLLNGAWVIIGATAFGIGDAVPTPLGNSVDGIEVHLQLISALLDNRIPYQPANTTSITFALFIVIILIFALLPYAKSRIQVYIFPLTGTLLALLLLTGHSASLAYGGVDLPWLLPALFSIVNGATAAIWAHARSQQIQARLYRTLGSYFPATAARRIAQQEPGNEIDAHREHVVILFADLRNFSAWCNQLPPEQVAAILHSFFQLCARSIHAHGGEIQEYVGDAVMGIWPATQNSQNALAAAQMILTEGAMLENAETHRDELPPLTIGIGIEQGEVLIGSFGPATRRAHAVLGHAVTAAIRLQDMTSELAHPILIGEVAAAFLQKNAPKTVSSAPVSNLHMPALESLGSLESQGHFLLTGLAHPYEIFAPTPIQGKQTL